jgi:hypothetical protein
MFSFDVPKTTHVCYESIFGHDLAQQTTSHLQHLSMAHSQMKVVLDSNSSNNNADCCRKIRSTVMDYLRHLCALEQSLHMAKADGYAVRIVRAPWFRWSSAGYPVMLACCGVQRRDGEGGEGCGRVGRRPRMNAWPTSEQAR